MTRVDSFLCIATLTCASIPLFALADEANGQWISANDAFTGQAVFGVQDGATILDCNDHWKVHPFKAPPAPEHYAAQPRECGNRSTPPPIHPGAGNFVLVISDVNSAANVTVTDKATISKLSQAANNGALSKSTFVLIWDAQSGKALSAKQYRALSATQKTLKVILQSGP